MAAETGFNIDGTIYEVPDIGTLTMDEAQVMYDYCGLGIEDFVQPEDETPEEAADRERRFRNPGFLRALMHIAYQRGNTKVPASRVKHMIGAANVITSLETLAVVEEVEEENPPALTSEPARPSPTSSPVNDSSPPTTNEPSGPSSTNGSDEQDENPAATTPGRSGLYSVLPPASSAT